MVVATSAEFSTRTLTVALLGNPNVGKSTLFNALARGRQRTGNWPGKTVERASGRLATQGCDVELVDLPGTYSLSAQSPEEIIARDFIFQPETDAIVVVMDAANLERNLNLLLQLLEVRSEVVVALNLMDEAIRKGWQIDIDALAQELGVPVVPTVATRGQGVTDLVEAMLDVSDQSSRSVSPTVLHAGTDRPAARLRVDYGTVIGKHIGTIAEELTRLGFGERAEWLAVRLLEDDPEVTRCFHTGELSSAWAGSRPGQRPSSPEQLRAVLARAVELREATRPDAKVEIVRRRYELADRIVRRCMRRRRPAGQSWTDRIDRIVTHRVWSWPIMLLMLTVVFWITIQGANLPSAWLQSLFGWFAGLARGGFESVAAPWWIAGPVVDGLIVGTGTVIAVMLPPMVIFFTAFHFFEDLGLIPRVAFNLDRPMRSVGSQGKHCLVCAMSYGCNVTGVLTSRIIDNEKDRLVAILTSPLVLCNGRFGAGVVLAILLFGQAALVVMISLVLFSLAAVFAATWVLNRTVFRGEPGGFVLELPPYRTPQLGRVLWQTLRHRVAHVMWRAILFAAPAALAIWVMGNVPRGAPFDQTPIGWVVAALEPIGRPLGLSGEMIASLLFALPAKEIVMSSLAMTYGLQTTLAEPQAVLAQLAASFTPLSAYCFMVFYMLYLPCFVTVWAIWKETGRWKWVLFGLAVPLATAYPLTFAIYRCGLLLGYS